MKQKSKPVETLTKAELHAAHILAMKEIYTSGRRRLTPAEKAQIGVAAEDDSDGPDMVRSHEAIAAAIRHHFKTECFRQYVSDWLRGRRWPCDAGAPPMPPATKSGRYSKASCFDWYREHVLGGTGKAPMDYRSRREKTESVRAALELELLQKANSDRYMLVVDHDNSLRNFAAIVWAEFCRVVERELIEGFAERVRAVCPDKAESLVDDARARHLRAVDELQKRFAAMADA